MNDIWNPDADPTRPKPSPHEASPAWQVLGPRAYEWIGRSPHEEEGTPVDWRPTAASVREVTYLNYKLSGSYWATTETEAAVMDMASTAYKPAFQDFRVYPIEFIHGPVVLGASTATTEETRAIAEVFRRLANLWSRDTDSLASPRARFMHAAYQQVIGLGPAALPLLLEELRDRPDDWFWALAAIAREDPASGLSDPDQARDAWLAWGFDRKLISRI